jgi:hypothetical protein
MDERRRLVRVNWIVETQVSLPDSSDVHWNVRLTDISEGGCFIDTMVPLEPNAKVKLQIDDGEETLVIRGKILYGQTSIGSAIQFEPLEPKLLARVRKIIASRVS